MLRDTRRHHSSTGTTWLHGHGAKGMLLLSRLLRCLGVLGHRIRIEWHLVRGALSRDGEASRKASIRVHRVIRCAHHNGGLLVLIGGWVMGLARYNLFCLPPAGLSESREATVGREVYLNYADRTDGRAGAKGGSKALLTCGNPGRRSWKGMRRLRPQRTKAISNFRSNDWLKQGQ